MTIPASAKYAIIRDMTLRDNNLLNIVWLCDAAGVSRSGYYHYLETEDLRRKREDRDQLDFESILKAYRFRGYAKGARSIYMRLLHMAPPVHMNIKKIRRLMKKYGLRCPIRKANPYRRMAKALKTNNVAPNLLNREFETHGPRSVLLTDITYIINGKAPRCYMSTIIDACTKELLAWVLSESLEIDFVLETVSLLIKNHGISLTAETLIHSDQGSHYTSVQFIRLIKDQCQQVKDRQ
jgi:transposase InsO family protein